MAQFSSVGLDSGRAYQLMTGVIVPRPIALVSTRSAQGQANLAPFSFFNGISHTPPTLAFAIGPGNGDRVKDTARNLDAHPEFIVHVVSEAMAQGAVAASAEVAPDVDEFSLAGFDAVPGTQVDVARVRQAQVAMECRVVEIVVIGPPAQPTRLIIGEILYWHIDDAVMAAPFRICSKSLRAVGRLSAGEFCKTDRTFRLRSPLSEPTIIKHTR